MNKKNKMGDSNLMSEPFVLNDKTTANVEFHIEDIIFYTHSQVLANFSEMFKNMFYGGMQESISTDDDQRKVIEYHQLNPETFQTVLNFMYCDNISINNENIYDIMYVSDYLCIVSLLELCETYLIENMITQENMICHYMGSFPTSAIVKHCLYLWPRSKHLSEFHKVNYESVIAILSLDELYFTEKELFDMVVQWIKYNEPEELECNVLMEHIRFSTMSSYDFEQCKTIIRELSLISDDKINSIQRAINNNEPYEKNRLPEEYFHCPFPVRNFIPVVWENDTTSYIGYESIEDFGEWVRVHFPIVYIKKADNECSEDESTSKQFMNKWYRTHSGTANINGVLAAKHLSKCMGYEYKDCTRNGTIVYPDYIQFTLPMMYYSAYSDSSNVESPHVSLRYLPKGQSVNDMDYFDAYKRKPK
jgi:hypothetical protein